MTLSIKKIEFQAAVQRVYAELNETPDINWNEIVEVNRVRMEEARNLLVTALVNGELTLFAVSDLGAKDGGARKWIVPKMTPQQYRQGLRMTKVTYKAPRKAYELYEAVEKYFEANEFERWIKNTSSTGRERVPTFEHRLTFRDGTPMSKMHARIAEAITACFPDNDFPMSAKQRNAKIGKWITDRGDRCPSIRTIERHFQWR